MKEPDETYRRYVDLQAYVRWTDDDAERVRSVSTILEPHLPALVEDFYSEIARHPEAHKVFTGGQAQIDRLRVALTGWLRDLLHGPYDRDYVTRRWRVGARHVEIGLDQVYTNVALSRLRDGFVDILSRTWKDDQASLIAVIRSLNKLLDLDLAKIEDAYQAEFKTRIQTSERLATLGQIAGGVAHELRNPLNVVKTSAYYLNRARNPSPEKRAEHMQRIERSVLRAEGVIASLTNFARQPEPDVAPFALSPSVQDAIESCDVPGGVEVAVEIPADLPDAVGDRGQIHIVLSNLVRNALDAMGPEGRLTVRARTTADGLEIDISDTGVGIPPGDLARVMEPLFSTKSRGMGLGLALSRMILEKNRGSLHVVSELQKGTTFTVRLQAAPSKGE